MARSIMLQGTASDVGKSILAAGLCRILAQDGFRVAPFKSQNMALNSGVTHKGEEMGRAQIFQAEAAGIEPDARMNPILLKPTGERHSQVIVLGKKVSDMNAASYHQFKTQLFEQVISSYNLLAAEYQIIVIEGAGSPAEINLREHDIVNMGLAERIDAPVILVADIDRGGVFASIYGTLALLSDSERQRVKGVIINKFRGDVTLLQPGIDMIEAMTNVPVLGVIPMLSIHIEDEDSVALSKHKYHTENTSDDQLLDIAVIKLPYIANFTDFNPLLQQPDVRLRYIQPGQQISQADLIIIPGSKNTLADLHYLYNSGLAAEIQQLAALNTPVIGICGGYQMLGCKIIDGIESQIHSLPGLGLLACHTYFTPEKTTHRVTATITAPAKGLFQFCQGTTIQGYEIHMGKTNPLNEAGKQNDTLNSETTYYFSQCDLVDTDNKQPHRDGMVSADGNVMGTYIHGLFDEGEFSRHLLNALRQRRGWSPLSEPISFSQFKQNQYDQLASAMRQHLDMAKIYQIINGEQSGEHP